MDRFNKLPPMTKMMGPLEREWDKDEACWADVCRKADELFSKLEARVAALEERSCCPLPPPPDREVKWAIIRDGRVYDSENGFRKDYNNHPLLFYTREDAICAFDILNLHDVDRGGEIEVRRVYVDTLEPVNPELDTETVEL